MSGDDHGGGIAGRPWARIDTYVVSLARSRSARRRSAPQPRTQPEHPRALLGTWPFLLVILAFGAMAVPVLIAAWPARERPAPPAPAVTQPGTAPADWFDRARKEMR